MGLLCNDAILLRAPEPEDLECLYRWENDADLWKFASTTSPYSRFALKEYISALTHDIYREGQLRFIIEDRACGIPVGTVDLYDFDPHHRRAGLGILVDKDFRRHHIASQSIRLISEYAFAFLHVRQLYVHIPVSNQSSIRLFESVGFVFSGVLKEWIYAEEGYEDVCVMQQLK